MKDFNRFKKKILREHLLKSVLVGLGAGLLAAALAIVVAFLTNPSVAVGVGAGSAVIVGGAMGYLYWHGARPTDKKIALRLDKKLGLHEKCATMIEFQGKDDALLNRQRDDANTTLAEKPTKALKLNLGVWVIPALAISSAFFTASFFTPKNTNSIEPGVSIVDSSGNVIDSWTSSLGGDAHSNISENSGANSEFKDIIDSIVNDVVNSLTGVRDIPARSSIVNDAKSHVNDAVDSFNSKEEIGKALKTESDQHLKSQGQHLIDGDAQGLRQDLQDMFDELNQLEGDELRDYAGELANQIDDALAKAKLAGVSEDDSLYQSYKELADWLRNIQDMPHNSDSTSSDPAHDVAESAIVKAASNIASNINEQNENEQIASKVKEIMDSMINPQPSDSNDSNPDSGPDDSNPDNTIINTETSGSTSDTEGPHETTTQGPVPSGSITDTSAPDDDPQPGPGPTPQPGPVDSGDSGPAGPGQPTEDPHTDIIYTGEDTVEYGSVIANYNGGFADDMTSGDTDDGDAADEYFNNLFGSDGDGNK